MRIRSFSGWAFPPDSLDGLVQGVVDRARPTRQPRELWLGWSLGGLRALAMAAESDRGADAPPDILVLIGSTPRFCCDDDGWPGTAPASLRRLERRLARDPAAAIAGFHAICAGAETTPEMIHSRCAASLALDHRDLAEGLQALASVDVRLLLPVVRQPVLVLHGGHDRVIPPEAAEAMAEQLPRAVRFEHPTAGHDLPLVQTRWTIDRIIEFVDGYEP